jgi:hypothetical protein
MVKKAERSRQAFSVSAACPRLQPPEAMPERLGFLRDLTAGKYLKDQRGGPGVVTAVMFEPLRQFDGRKDIFRIIQDHPRPETDRLIPAAGPLVDQG